MQATCSTARGPTCCTRRPPSDTLRIMLCPPPPTCAGGPPGCGPRMTSRRPRSSIGAGGRLVGVMLKLPPCCSTISATWVRAAHTTRRCHESQVDISGRIGGQQESVSAAQGGDSGRTDGSARASSSGPASVTSTCESWGRLQGGSAAAAAGQGLCGAAVGGRCFGAPPPCSALPTCRISAPLHLPTAVT